MTPAALSAKVHRILYRRYSSVNPTLRGFCAIAAGMLSAQLDAYKIDHTIVCVSTMGGSHCWVLVDGKILDPTVQQFWSHRSPGRAYSHKQGSRLSDSNGHRWYLSSGHQVPMSSGYEVCTFKNRSKFVSHLKKDGWMNCQIYNPDVHNESL